MSKNSKFCNFWANSTCFSSKESIFYIEFNFKQKKYDLFQEKLKKSNFFIFFFKIDADLLSSNARFSNLCEKIQKLSSPVLRKRFEIKSHQRKACYLKPCRNGRPIPTGGGLKEPPPHWLGLKSWSLAIASWFMHCSTLKDCPAFASLQNLSLLLKTANSAFSWGNLLD